MPLAPSQTRWHRYLLCVCSVLSRVCLGVGLARCVIHRRSSRTRWHCWRGWRGGVLAQAAGLAGGLSFAHTFAHILNVSAPPIEPELGGSGHILLYPLLMSRFILGYPQRDVLFCGFLNGKQLEGWLRSLLYKPRNRKKYIYILWAWCRNGWLAKDARSGASLATLRSAWRRLPDKKRLQILMSWRFVSYRLIGLIHIRTFALLGTKTNSFAFLRYGTDQYRP